MVAKLLVEEDEEGVRISRPVRTPGEAEAAKIASRIETWRQAGG